MSQLWRRSTHRLLHLLPAVALGVFLYSPLRTLSEAVLVAQLLLFPSLALSGVLLWKGPRIRQWFGE
ncbi:hypothetical protein [Halapricum salinum]|uniref:Uncharacterized protein n=1 Tax=Halapricum salinum TaxID=1457250 RepID=A0A4D6HD75_9EURY|nr:hypothetical protein [Halapricum salinum]QCC51929.1 hypothetical protein DV733_12125 [Halapricum salinum]